MKFILLYLSHSLLLLLPIKTKQPPIVRLPNLKNYYSQNEEECIDPKNIKNIIQSNDHQTQSVLEWMLDELILFFNSLNGPFLQVFSRSLLILDSLAPIFYLISFPI